MTRRSPARDSASSRSRSTGSSSGTGSSSSSSSGGKGRSNPYATLATGGALLILGIGIGIAFNTVSPNKEVATGNYIDNAAPNREFCIQYGRSSMVVNNRIYITWNPFSVYVAQAVMEPGCVIRSENWNVLQQRNLIDNDQVRRCKANMNTFAYTGNIDDSSKAKVECVYESGPERNLFNEAMSGATPTPTVPTR